MNALLLIYGVAGGGYFVVNIIIGGNTDKTPYEIALGVFATFLWLLLFFVITYIVIQAFGNLLIGLGNYYPIWYYFPKLKLSNRITANKEIELRVINSRRRQKLSLRMEFYYVELRSKPSKIRGVAPPAVKELLALDAMPGGAIRIKIIGKVIDGGMILSTGNKSEEVRFTEPGLYDYSVNMSGEFRGRKYGAHATVPFRITDNHEVKTEE